MTNKKNMDAWIQARRIDGLRRFALAITVFNILGHTVFGFEQSWAQPLVSLATAYACELFCEWMEARGECRRPRFLGSGRACAALPKPIQFWNHHHPAALSVGWYRATVSLH